MNTLDINQIVKDINQILKDIQYKPNFAFKAYKENDGAWIRIVMWVENSREPVKPWVVQREEFDNYNDFGYRYITQAPLYYSPRREIIEVIGNYKIPSFDFESGEELLFVEWFGQLLLGMEQHELDEWLRYKGKLLNDPHAEENDG